LFQALAKSSAYTRIALVEAWMRGLCQQFDFYGTYKRITLGASSRNESVTSAFVVTGLGVHTGRG